jgi:hypothetical protein
MANILVSRIDLPTTFRSVARTAFPVQFRDMPKITKAAVTVATPSGRLIVSQATAASVFINQRPLKGQIYPKPAGEF